MEVAAFAAANAAILSWARFRFRCAPVGAAFVLAADEEEEDGAPCCRAASARSVWKRLAKSPLLVCSAILAVYALCGC